MEKVINGVLYRYCEQFDVNLTLQYENDRWDEWHIIREFMSNALDAVDGQIDSFSLSEEEGFIHIHDHGSGYPINYAKRIGASSKKNDEQSKVIIPSNIMPLEVIATNQYCDVSS